MTTATLATLGGLALDDLLAEPDPPPAWVRRESALVGPHRYEVELARVRSGAEALDLVAHVAGKTWATPEVLEQLARHLQRHMFARSRRRRG